MGKIQRRLEVRKEEIEVEDENIEDENEGWNFGENKI